MKSIRIDINSNKGAPSEVLLLDNGQGSDADFFYLDWELYPTIAFTKHIMPNLHSNTKKTSIRSKFKMSQVDCY